MQNWYAHLRAETYRREEQIAEAMQYRLLHANEGFNPRPLRAHEQWIIWLGDRLEEWGRDLKSRYTPRTIGEGPMQVPSLHRARS